MSHTQPHRKQVKHYHEPGDFHELTFSCYRRMQLLTNDAWRGHLARSIDAALADEEFLLIAFVLMPEHVHLLVYPTRPDADAESISRFLGKLKRPCSASVKADLMASGSRLLERLTRLSQRSNGLEMVECSLVSLRRKDCGSDVVPGRD
jgi:putative transposase